MSVVLLSAFIAGLLTVLSPCVLFTLPFVVNSSLQIGKKGPVLLMLGLVISFVILGITFMTATSFIGISEDNLQLLVAVILLFVSILLLSSVLNNNVSHKLSGVATIANNLLNKLPTNTALGQFITGLLLGAVWSPCSGPSIGLALSLVSTQQDIAYGALIMLTFGIAASIPLILIAYGSSSLIKQHTKSLQNLYTWTKIIMGLFILTYSLLLLTGWDKNVESIILNILPEYIINLTTKY